MQPHKKFYHVKVWY